MPKRSTGCDLCRRRKVRCDETKPFCQRCINLGASCPGYSQATGVVFKDQTGMVTRRSQSQQPKDGRGAPLEQSREASALAGPSNPRQAAVVPYRMESPSSSPADIDTAPATRMNLYATFHNLFVPASTGLSEDLLAPYHYIGMAMDTSPAHRALSSALDTVTVAFLATQNRDPNLHYEASKLYGRAIVDIHRALGDPVTQIQDETLAAVSIFANCDFFKGTAMATSAWIGHINGVQGLLANRGPSSVQTPLAWRTFLNNRFQAIAAGFLFRKAGFYDRPDWIALTAEAAKENHFVSLTDILVHIPRWMEDMDNALDAQDGFDVPRILSMLQRCTRLLGRLDGWYTNLIAKEGEDILRTTNIETMPEFVELCPDIPFSTVFSYSSVPFGFLISYHFFSKFHLVRGAVEILELLSQWPDTLSDISTAVPNLPSVEILRNQSYENATFLTRSIPFFYTGPCATIGRIQSMGFLWFAQDYFGSRSESAHSTAADIPWQEFSITHAWCWKMFAVIQRMDIVVPSWHPPARSNTRERVKPSSPEDDVNNFGLNIHRVARELGVDLDAPLPKLEDGP